LRSIAITSLITDQTGLSPQEREQGIQAGEATPLA
jgi:hypothetical protein